MKSRKERHTCVCFQCMHYEIRCAKWFLPCGTPPITNHSMAKNICVHGIARGCGHAIGSQHNWQKGYDLITQNTVSHSRLFANNNSADEEHGLLQWIKEHGGRLASAKVLEPGHARHRTMPLWKETMTQAKDDKPQPRCST
jgi:hypothetical protein